jgi:photosystem II stability/assembly factor-like uncharacterized protein
MRGILVAIVISILSGMQTLLAQSTWIKQNPLLGNKDLESVYFVDTQTGWALGRETILKTGDGGANWTAQNSGMSEWLLSVYCIDVNTAWAVGPGGTILNTTDGGMNWIPQNSGLPDGSLYSIYFTDANVGWAVGYDYSSENGQQGVILNTTDGGGSWSSQIIENTETLASVYFVTSNTGWAVGWGDNPQGFGYLPKILKTVDSGTTWVPQSAGEMSDRLTSVHFIDETTGWTVGTNGTILNTSDGGANWITQTSNTRANLEAVSFADAQNGLAVGEGFLDGKIVRTTDGGATWTEQTVDKGLKSVCFVNAQTGWTVGKSGIVLRSIDGGLTWENKAYATLETLFSTFFLSEQIGWAGGRKGTLLKTINGGLNWEKVATPTDYRTYYQIYFADSQRGWACATHGKILKTVDGGTTWTEKSTSSTKAFHDICFINSNIGWVVGGGSIYSEIFKTSDGGDSWIPQISPAEKCLFGVYFIDSSIGWAVGMDGAILKTEDGGANWNFKNSDVPIDAWLEDVYFKDANIGFVVGKAIILQTIDGGDNWTQKNNISGWLEKIIFMDANNGLVLGTKADVGKGIDGPGNIDLYGSSGAKIWKTSDGGNNWDEELLPVGRWILDAYCADLNSGWAVGSLGTILRHTNSLPLPSAPSDLKATAISETQIMLSWSDNSANEDGFHIYRSDGVSGAYNHLTSVEANDTSYTDTEITNGTTYWYFVRAFNLIGSSAKTLDAFATAGMVSVKTIKYVPTKFVLNQNYPNPFNPSTVISWHIGATGMSPVQVELSIYNILGQKIATLLNKPMPAGYHEIEFNSGKLSSGVYLYRIVVDSFGEAGKWQDVRKMLYLK